MPEYKDLSPIQFMIGFMGCIQEEASNSVKSNMLEYGRHLLQDALETNWATARHTHFMLLQEIERGKCSWKRPDAIERSGTQPELFQPRQVGQHPKLQSTALATKCVLTSTVIIANFQGTTLWRVRLSSTLAPTASKKQGGSAITRSRTAYVERIVTPIRTQRNRVDTSV